MATFTVSGYEITSGLDNQVSDSKVAQLQFVAPLGEATLDFRYVTEDSSSAEVSLSDYNILLNGLHLNDGELPDRIELFNATWPLEGEDSASSQIFNLPILMMANGAIICSRSIGPRYLTSRTRKRQITS